MSRAIWGGGMLLILAALTGCGDTGSMADEESAPIATYAGLIKQRCGVMVWADSATKNQYPPIELDLARAVQERLAARTRPTEEKKKPELADAEFISAASVISFRRAHPELAASPVTDVAPKLGVSRLIYIEVEQFEAQSPVSILLLKGTAKAALKVVEVSDGAAKVAFEESDISATYPPGTREGVVPSDTVNVETVYRATVAMLADHIAARFQEAN